MYSRSTASRSSKVEGAAAEDLHRAGHARPGRQPEAMLGPVALDELDLLGPRADEAHVAPQHVDELRQLVEARAGAGAPDAGHPRIVAAT